MGFYKAVTEAYQGRHAQTTGLATHAFITVEAWAAYKSFCVVKQTAPMFVIPPVFGPSKKSNLAKTSVIQC